MRGIFITVRKCEDFYHKDLLDTEYKERFQFYNTLSKGQVVHILEQFVSNKILEEKRNE